MFSIKFAKKEDFGDIEKIAKLCNAFKQLNFMQDIFMVLKDKITIGFISMKIEENTAIITNIAILPDYRNQGYENLLVRVILNEAVEMGLNKAYVNLPIYNEFFASLGFERQKTGLSVNLNEFFGQK